MPVYTSPVRLLERDHPIEVLQTRAERAAAGHGGLVLLVGEAGIGKTALLRAFAERVSMPVLWGMCDPLSTPRPLGPLRDVAGALGSAVTASLRESAAQHEIFAAVLDALRATSPSCSTDTSSTPPTSIGAPRATPSSSARSSTSPTRRCPRASATP
jgi:predicted ATPase